MKVTVIRLSRDSRSKKKSRQSNITGVLVNSYTNASSVVDDAIHRHMNTHIYHPSNHSVTSTHELNTSNDKTSITEEIGEQNGISTPFNSRLQIYDCQPQDALEDQIRLDVAQGRYILVHYYTQAHIYTESEKATKATMENALDLCLKIIEKEKKMHSPRDKFLP